MVAAGRLVIMGDMNGEISTTLGGFRFADVVNDQLVYSDLAVDIGGTAANLALAAAHHFARVSVLGAVGRDAFGQMLLDALSHRGVQVLEPSLPGGRTGLAVYIRDDEPSTLRGTRLLVVDQGVNPLLDCVAVARHTEMIAGSDVFFFDGYCLLREPRRSAALYAVDIARRSGVATVLDLVPHDAHHYFSADEVQQWLRSIDLLIAEVGTIRLLLGLNVPVSIDSDTARETWTFLARTFSGLEAHLRFGVGNIDEALYCQPGGQIEHRRTGYAIDPDPRGFGDRLSAADVAAFARRRARR